MNDIMRIQAEIYSHALEFVQPIAAQLWPDESTRELYPSMHRCIVDGDLVTISNAADELNVIVVVYQVIGHSGRLWYPFDVYITSLVEAAKFDIEDDTTQHQGLLKDGEIVYDVLTITQGPHDYQYAGLKRKETSEHQL